MRYIGILLILFLGACGTKVLSSISDTQQSPPSSVPRQAAGKSLNKEKNIFFTFTNDFRSHQGVEHPYIRLLGQNKQIYVIPPVEYGVVEVEDVVIDGFKVESGCVNIPQSAFPVTVHVCHSQKCASSWKLGNISHPNHYSIMGVGALLLLQVNPVSPCSDKFEEYIKMDKNSQPVPI